MSDPEASIAAEAEAGTQVAPDGALVESPQGPSFGDRALELFKPCPEDPLTKTGGLSGFVNGALAKRSGVPLDQIHVGQNVAHCIDHLWPGGGSGWPPIVNLALSIMEYRAAAAKLHPDTPPLVRP